MSAQALDLRRFAQIVWRHKRLAPPSPRWAFLGGIGYAVLNPPMLTSQAVGVFPYVNNISSQAVVETRSGRNPRRRE